MVRVFLTRPLQDSEILARDLSAHGYQTVIEPLLTIQPMLRPAPDFDRLQAVMITSAHALDFLDPVPAYPLFALPCFCVGASTAEAARRFGFTAIHQGNQDGLALAHHISGALMPGNGTLLHLAGRDSDKAGRAYLQQQGFTVTIWVTYAAEATTQLSPAAIDLWRTEQIDAVVVFSSRTAGTLKTLLKKHGLEMQCRSVIGLAISDAVRSVLEGLPWRRLETAPLGCNAALLPFLQKHLPVSEVSHD